MSIAWAIAGLVVGAGVSVGVGVPLGLRAYRRQVARLTAAERRARAAERMAEIGAMTGGLAHEIKNPLSTIGLNAQLLVEGMEELAIDDAERSRIIRRLDTLRRESERLRDILTDFLSFAGELRLHPEPADLTAIAAELADFYAPQAHHHGVRFRHETARDAMPVRVDVGHIKQAILNLLINATQAMTGRDDGAPRELILRTTDAELDGTPAYAVHVIDTGPGIPDDVAQRIFTPYFTTKSGGSGLGLPTSRRLVEEHGGTIDLHTEEGVGTDFVITLPARDVAEPAKSDADR